MQETPFSGVAPRTDLSFERTQVELVYVQLT